MPYNSCANANPSQSNSAMMSGFHNQLVFGVLHFFDVKFLLFSFEVVAYIASYRVEW